MEVENTKLYIKAFDSYIETLKRDFDFTQENLSLAISAGLKEVETIKNGRISCKSMCTIGAVGAFNQVYSGLTKHGAPSSDAAAHARAASVWYYVGCMNGCTIIE